MASKKSVWSAFIQNRFQKMHFVGWYIVYWNRIGGTTFHTLQVRSRYNVLSCINKNFTNRFIIYKIKIKTKKNFLKNFKYYLFNLSQLCHNRATWVFSRRSTASLQAFYSASLAQECVNSVIRQQQPRLQPIQRQQQFCRLTT